MSVIQFVNPPTWPKTRKVAALYVSPLGPYPRLVHEWFDEKRDARTYAGPLPVVAHPPCGPWGSLRKLCTKQDRDLGPRAVDQVRRWGGVLEHPAHSSLWDYCDLPKPPGVHFRHGKPAGFTLEANQVWFGHPCMKPTWIYVASWGNTVDFLRIYQRKVRGLIRLEAKPVARDCTHVICAGPRARDLPVASRRKRTLTPPYFAQWLIDIAKECQS